MPVLPVEKAPDFAAICDGCGRQCTISAPTKADAIKVALSAGWEQSHSAFICPACLDQEPPTLKAANEALERASEGGGA